MNRKAFTLVELLVVIAIIGLLSAVAVVATSSSKQNARNAKRKADLVQISKALELYYAANNAYPVTGGWWGQGSTFGAHPDTGPTGWIPDLAPTYIARLPRDPLTANANPNSMMALCRDASWASNITGYVYWSDGRDYKVAADCLPEGPIATTDPFYDPSAGVGQAFSLHTPGAETWW